MVGHSGQLLCLCAQGLTLVFVAKKRDADAIEDFLVENKFPAVTIHGDRTQEEREYVRNSLSNKGL